MRVLNKTASGLMQAYYLGPDHPMKLRIWDWIWSGLGHPRLQIPYMKKGRITVDIRDWLQGEIFRRGAYESEVWEALASHAVNDEVVWDVGAHIGSLSIRAMLDSRIREVHAFEPNPEQQESLHFNLSINPGIVRAHALALSDHEETRRLSSGLVANTGMASLVTGAIEGGVRVACQTADHLIYNEGIPAPTLMKIDVEGWERSVLEGARRLLADQPPKAIVYEAECRTSGEAIDRTLEAFIEQSGYRIHRIVRPSGVIDTRENFLAVRA